MNGELPILEGAIQVSAGIVLLALVLNVGLRPGYALGGQPVQFNARRP